MPRQSEIVPCVDCQEMFPRRKLNPKGRCSQCAMVAFADTFRQLHNHSGPYYEKWKRSMAEAASKKREIEEGKIYEITQS